MGVVEKKKTEQRQTNTPTFQHTLPPYAGPPVRLDVWLSSHKPDLSRVRWQELIKTRHVRVNHQVKKPSYVLRENDIVETEIPPPEPTALMAQEIPLNILFEDADILVLNKPAGLVVHPAPGHASGTVVNALLHHCTDLAGVGGDLRPGIVHRLDRDTSGVLVIAKNDHAMAGLASQFKLRKVHKQYTALVWGHPIPAHGTIETLVGRNPRNRKKMSARPLSGRPAITHYEIVRTFPKASLLRVCIETGRTHQIRVHLAHIGHPIVGDSQYGRLQKTDRPIPVSRQMLHAEYLKFTHPRTGVPLEFQAPMPEDMRNLVEWFTTVDTSRSKSAEKL